MPRRLYLFLISLLIPAAVALGLIWRDIGLAPNSEPAVVAPQPVAIQTPAPIATSSTNATIIRVVDGDTFVAALDSEPGEWTVRMLGIDTPETKDPRKPVGCFGPEASQKLSDLLSNQRVNLQADLEADEIDKYSRLLRNVFLADGTDVNALMVREGYAYAYLSFPLNVQRKTELRNLQKQAQESLRGLWGSCN